jgi:hypothetical protein
LTISGEYLYIHGALKTFVEWYKKKRRYKQINYIGFLIIPILHNTLLATPKIKSFLGFLPIFGEYQQSHQLQFLWAKTQFYCVGASPFGEASTLKFYSIDV